MPMWHQALENALPALRHYLHPIDEYARYYPNPNYPSGIWLMVVHYPDDTVGAISEDREVRIPLELDDIVCYRLHLGLFRDMLAKTLGIVPATDQPKKSDRVIRLGHYQLAPGEEYPVYAVLDGGTNDFHQDVMQLLLKNKNPFLLVSGTRTAWHDTTLEILQERRIPLVPLCEALEFRDDQFIATDVWYGAVEEFRQALHPGNMVAVPDYEFARRGGWSLRFGRENKEPTVLPGDLLGAFYIQRLLMFPHKEIHVTILLAEVAGDDQLRVTMDGQEVIDQQARQDYKQRLEELAADRYEAESNEDESWLERIDRETDQIADMLIKSTGLGGKTRKMGDNVQNIRRRVAKTIKEVIEKNNENDPQLARHLTNSIHTNIDMCYRPDRDIAWVFN